jgi:steroid 5-alpha reductase family enzyme
MIDWNAYLASLAVIFAAGFVTWLVSLVRRDVSIVDSLWSLMFLLGAASYILFGGTQGPRTTLVMILLAAWSLRLAAYITIRNHGEPEDRRYQAIRENNQPHFWFKSLFIVFGLQSFLAWVICLPVIAAVSAQTPPGPLDYAAVALWVLGMFFEVVGDHQLTQFRRKAAPGAVLNTGLWRYTRHPNYFGEAALWWGFYLLAVSAGGWWTVFAPVLMTFLLVRVSGVALLEKDIAQRRPAYRDYIRQTNAFLPWRPRLSSGNGAAVSD